MTHWLEISQKHLGKISKIASWIFNIAGVVLAILSFIKDDYDLGWVIVLAIVIFNSIFLMIVSIYETLLFKRGSKIEKDIKEEKQAEIDKLKESLFFSHDLNDKLIYYYQYIVSTLNKFLSQLCAVNTKFEYDKKTIQKVVDNYTRAGVPIDDEIEKQIKELQEKAEKEYRQSMLKEFDHFLSNVTGKLKATLDIALKAKGCLLETSISVKQFSKIVSDPDNVSDVGIITTFRDHQTHSQGKREIGVKEYSIRKNTDFIYCLTHSYFLKNNITADDKTYDNENRDFLNYYNCTIVVPIVYRYPDKQHIYGYLTCDILNKNNSVDNLLDEKMAEIMVATANIIGIYFDSMDFQWEYVLEDDFLDIVYNMKKSKYSETEV